MPSAIDLAGRRFGRLTVIEREGSVFYGSLMTAWRCRCDCGVELSVPRSRLPYRPGIDPSQIVDACPACRMGRKCVVCGKAFIPASSRAITCSQVCRDERRAQTRRKARRKRDAADPDAVRDRHARYRASIAADPQRRRARLRKQKAWYGRKKDAINAERRNHRSSETPEQRAERLAATRAYMRQWLAELRADPERHADYLAMQTESRRKARLAALLRLGAQLGDKL